MASSSSRIQKELKEIMDSPIINCSAGPIEDNLFQWAGTIMGPLGTPYEGGVFELSIQFPDDYPYRPPQLRFVTPIFHCNVSQAGTICLDILKDSWSPILTIGKVLLSLCSLLSDPNPEDPLRADVADLYARNKDSHDELARLHTQTHAGGHRSVASDIFEGGLLPMSSRTLIPPLPTAEEVHTEDVQAELLEESEYEEVEETQVPEAEESSDPEAAEASP